MKAIIDPHLAVKELKKLSLIISKNTILPILSMVRMDFDKSSVSITASDLETTIVTKMNCEGKSPFSVVVDFADLLEIMNKLKEPVTIEEDEKVVSIRSDDAKFKLPKGGKPSDFPSVPEENFNFSFKADMDFFEALYSADQCKNPNEMMVSSSTACIDFKKDILSIVGTDAFVLFKKDFKIKTGKHHQSLVGGKFVAAVKHFQDAEIFIGEKFVKASDSNTIITTRVQDAKYCQYGSILPETVDYNLEINRSSLISAINTVSTTSSKSTRMCALHFNGDPNKIKITSEDIDFGKEGEIFVRASHEVQIEAIGISASQFLKLLGVLDDENIKLSIRTATQSIFLKNAQSNDTLCLLQPLMLNN
jgi:DNA polymerase-3 subunit beta